MGGCTTTWRAGDQTNKGRVVLQWPEPCSITRLCPPPDQTNCTHNIGNSGTRRSYKLWRRPNKQAAWRRYEILQRKWKLFLAIHDVPPRGQPRLRSAARLAPVVISDRLSRRAASYVPLPSKQEGCSSYGWSDLFVLRCAALSAAALNS
jgi:hypothetical protein